MKKYHHEPHGAVGETLRDFVYGFNDGLITTLAIVSALSGASVGNLLIIFAGIANVLADGISMSLGGYISSKSQVEVYKNALRQERDEVKNIPDMERQEIRNIYRKKGFKGKELERIVKVITSNKERWVDVMMKEELELTESKFINPVKVAAVVFAGFLLAGFIPLVPYLFFDIQTSLQYAVTVSFISLFVLGSLRSIFTKRNWFKSGLEMLAVGMLAAAAAYFIGSLVKLL